MRADNIRLVIMQDSLGIEMCNKGAHFRLSSSPGHLEDYGIPPDIQPGTMFPQPDLGFMDKHVPLNFDQYVDKDVPIIHAHLLNLEGDYSCLLSVSWRKFSKDFAGPIIIITYHMCLTCPCNLRPWRG